MVSPKRSNSAQGFTLLEVVIAMSILAVMTLFIAQAVRTAMKNRAKYSHQIEETTVFRDALRVIKRDIYLAFHHHDYNAELYNASWKERIRLAQEKEKKGSDGKKAEKKVTEPADKKQLDDGTAPPRSQVLLEQFKERKPKQLTGFLGEEDKVNFTSLSNIRSKKNALESDQIEVGYFTRECKDRFNKKKSSNCLWRRKSPILDDKVDEGGTESVLIERVVDFKLEYTGEGFEEEWVRNWSSINSSGDSRQQNKFPTTVKVTLSMTDSKNEKKIYKTTMTVPLRFPNNQEPKKQEAVSEDPTTTEGALPPAPSTEN